MKFSNSCCLAVSIGPSVMERIGNVYETKRPSSSDCLGSGQKGAEQRVPMLRGDAFRMKLDAMRGGAFMAHGHHRAILAPGVGHQRRARINNGKRMIARRVERRWKSGEQPAAVMGH